MAGQKQQQQQQQAKPVDFATVLSTAASRAFNGGVSGAAAMGLQVCSLMWMRTTMNYQYRNGTSTRAALRTLYAEGGVRRFYRGIGPALLQGPLSRFGDTAANAGVLSLLDANDATKDLPVVAKTAAASTAAAAWRICIMPIDTTKTMLQVNGSNGLPLLTAKLRSGGPRVLFHGAIGASAATFVGHMPWFTTYNFLDSKLPPPETLPQKLSRSALMGFCASVVSDTISNSLRVIKTTKQTFETPITYQEAVKAVIQKDGVAGLFGRGLQTRIMANGLQGLMFSVLWKLIDDALSSRG